MSEEKPKAPADYVVSSKIVGSALGRFNKKYTRILIIFCGLIIIFVGAIAFLSHRHDKHIDIKNVINSENKEAAKSLQASINGVDQQIAQDTDTQEKVNDYITKASYLLQRNDINGAIDAYKQAYKIAPSDINILVDLGNAYMTLKDKNNTLFYYDKAVSLIKSNPKSEYAANLSYYEAVISNVQKGDFTPPKAGADEAHPNG